MNKFKTEYQCLNKEVLHFYVLVSSKLNICVCINKGFSFMYKFKTEYQCLCKQGI